MEKTFNPKGQPGLSRARQAIWECNLSYNYNLLQGSLVEDEGTWISLKELVAEDPTYKKKQHTYTSISRHNGDSQSGQGRPKQRLVSCYIQ